MRILITAATQPELNAVSSRCCEGSEKKHTVDLLVTGLGSVATAYKLTKALTQKQYDLAINIGIAGSFSNEYPAGEVVVVSHDCFADFGVIEAQGFKTAFDMTLLSPDELPFTNGWINCPYVDQYPALTSLPKVRAATVNAVTGTKERFEELRSIFAPAIEGMEGAAFFYVCVCEGTPFLQIRSVSNRVGVRNKSEWNIPLALKNLGETLRLLISSL